VHTLTISLRQVFPEYVGVRIRLLKQPTAAATAAATADTAATSLRPVCAATVSAFFGLDVNAFYVESGGST
jgi:hypothetical protein